MTKHFKNHQNLQIEIYAHFSGILSYWCKHCRLLLQVILSTARAHCQLVFHYLLSRSLSNPLLQSWSPARWFQGCNDARDYSTSHPRVCISICLTSLVYCCPTTPLNGSLSSSTLTSRSPNLVSNANMVMLNYTGLPNGPRVMAHIISCQPACEPPSTTPSESDYCIMFYLPASSPRWSAFQ